MPPLHARTLCGWLLPGPIDLRARRGSAAHRDSTRGLAVAVSLVRFEPAGAQVHLVVSLLGFTPGSLVVLAGAEQPLNLPPPSLVFDSELAEAVVGADVD